jgi:lipid-A-disaccharide synthase-like uncharacterized protein
MWKEKGSVTLWDQPVPWIIFGISAGVIFYSRFYVQWVVSERKRKSVVPDAFWYQSIVGSLMLMVWSFRDQSPLGALSQSLNVVPYSRNVVHIWREKGRLTRTWHIILNTAPVFIALVALGVVALIWWREFEHTQTMTAGEARRNWLWLGIGVAGQALFAGRFLIQWAATEWQRKSVMPTVFWYLSVAASILQIGTYVQRHEWVFAVGLVANLAIYARNIWMIHKGAGPVVPTD